MLNTIRIICVVGVTALASVSAQAACGGGGYKPSTTSPKVQVVKEVSVTKAQNVGYLASDEHHPKLQSAQRDIDKAQTKLENCHGDCEKERRKLAEAKAKYARKASELEAN